MLAIDNLQEFSKAHSSREPRNCSCRTSAKIQGSDTVE
jgi:hypothetical protein